MILWMINHAACYVVHIYSLCIVYTSTVYFVARRNEILLSNLIVTVQHGDVPEPQNHDCFFSVNIHTFIMLTVKVNAAIYSMRTAFIQEYYSALKKKKRCMLTGEKNWLRLRIMYSYVLHSVFMILHSSGFVIVYIIVAYFLFLLQLSMPFKIGGKKRPSGSSSSDNAPAMNIGPPTAVKHNFHVGFNQDTGDFEGLPPAWTALLQSSNIS